MYIGPISSMVKGAADIRSSLIERERERERA